MQKLDLKIINGTIANSTETFCSDIGIKDGIIVAIGKEIGDSEKIIDAKFIIQCPKHMIKNISSNLPKIGN